MCGIVGIFNHQQAQERLMKAMACLQERGRDAVGMYDGTQIIHTKSVHELQVRFEEKIALGQNNALGHVLHAMVGIIPQPFLYEGRSGVMNCEIYNWKELAERYHVSAKNDAELLFSLILSQGIGVLSEVDGPFAFAVWDKGKVSIGRDLIGEKPVWYTVEDGFAFASERKALLTAGYFQVQELNPRHILTYTLESNTTMTTMRPFFSRLPEHTESKNVLEKKLTGFLINAIAKRVPDEKVALLFSGGVDSLFIARILQQLEVPFMCYTVAVGETAPDLLWARKIAKHYGFPLQEVLITSSDIPQLLKTVVPLIEDSNAVKVGVGLAMYAGCAAARKDQYRVIFSGVGAEELFTGYLRHAKTLAVSQDNGMVNEDCLSGLLKLYERDLYRDDVIAMHNNLELRLPFLDKDLVDYAIKIPAQYKLQGSRAKIILRDLAPTFGILQDHAERKKMAIQYGSRFDKALIAAAKKNKQRTRSSYLRTFFPETNMRLGCLYSSGKDSHLALHFMRTFNYDISCLITLKSENPDSYMFHTPAIDLVHLQAQAMNIPLLVQSTRGVKEEELHDLEYALIAAKEKYHIQGIVSGALFSNYQRSRIEALCDKLGLKIFCPLWHMDQETVLRELMRLEFVFVMSSVAAEGLDQSWLNKPIGSHEIDALVALHKKNGFHVAGEGGEYESLVLYGPDYKKKIKILRSHIDKTGKHAARLIIDEAVLE
jgi:asparagine synthase (glutamine-hydrolysing)